MSFRGKLAVSFRGCNWWFGAWSPLVKGIGILWGTRFEGPKQPIYHSLNSRAMRKVIVVDIETSPDSPNPKLAGYLYPILKFWRNFRYTIENKKIEPANEGLEDAFLFKKMFFRFHVSFRGSTLCPGCLKDSFQSSVQDDDLSNQRQPSRLAQPLVFFATFKVPKITWSSNHQQILDHCCWWQREIRRSPVEVGRLAHYLRRVSYIPGGCLGFQPSTVWLNITHGYIKVKVLYSTVSKYCFEQALTNLPFGDWVILNSGEHRKPSFISFCCESSGTSKKVPRFHYTPWNQHSPWT